MQCSKETLVWLFYNVSSASLLLLLFLHFSSTLLLKILNLVGSYPIIQRNQNGYESYSFSDEEGEEEDANQTYTNLYDVCSEEDHLAADMVHGCESSLHYMHNNGDLPYHQERVEKFINHDQGPMIIVDDDEDQDDNIGSSDEQLSHLASAGSEFEPDDVNRFEEVMPTEDADSVHDSVPNQGGPTSAITMDLHKSGLTGNGKKYGENYINQEAKNKSKVETNFSADERFLIFAPTQSESKKLLQVKDDEETYGDSCTVGSTSKSSSEWRSSIKDSGTEDPFSSSSRRSCPRWESYTVFQKYDEEMMFLDRISAQKLHETESLKSIQVNPRSFSDRIVHKFATAKNKPSGIRHNPYHELEATYVAQICLTWEALNWNYINFLRKRASWRDFDPGCAARVAQHFQQFQVLLQRYIENEPYEQGRRPEVYARMRLLAPKLLLVPEYRDSEDDQKDEAFGSKITSAAFLTIMEDGIRTFMNFLKADKEKPCQVLAAFFRRNKRGLVDPALLNLMKKVNNKKKTKLKDLRRSRKCLRKRKLKVEEEMEILMGLIDLKIVSRVLRMSDLSEEQLHWCEEKMSKVRVMDGKLQRDSSPLFFPAH